VKKLLLIAVLSVLAGGPILVFALAPGPDAGSRPVEHKAYNGYAEARDSGLQGDASFLAITSQPEFSQIFGAARGAPDPIAKDAFDTRLFLAVIKRGDGPWELKVEKVTAKGETLTVQYRAVARSDGGTRRGETAKAGSMSTTKAGSVRTTEKKPLETAKAEAPKATEKAGAPKATGIAPRATVKGGLTTERARATAAGSDSSLVLSVPKDNRYQSVVFVENGRKVGTARVGP
jgi:hypothetical protein